MSGAEQGILSLLAESGGELLQSEIVRQGTSSKSRVSEVLTSLEKRGLVSRHQLGKNYRVVLRGDSRKQNYVARERHLRLGFTKAAEYPFVIPFRKRMRNNLGIDVELRIYDNGVNVARDLSLLRLDLGIAPILASFMHCSLGAPFKIIAPAGSGGSSVISRKDLPHNSRPSVATTKLSTMELLLKSSVREQFLPEESKVVYASSPTEMMKGLISRRFDAACIWEPYATILARKHGLSKVVSYNEIGEHVCCALAAGNHLDDRTTRKVASEFEGSMIEFLRSPDSFLQQYCAITGFDRKITEKVSHEYTHPLNLDIELIWRQFELAGIQTPAPSTIKEMIRPVG